MVVVSFELKTLFLCICFLVPFFFFEMRYELANLSYPVDPKWEVEKADLTLY